MSGATKLMTAGGGGVSLTPDSSIASDVTVNVPSQNCTLGIQGPAFSAYRDISAQSLTSAVWNKVQLNAKLFDTNSLFDTTNYRFTPNIPGYYQFNGSVHVNGNLTRYLVCIYKNGSDALNGSDITVPSGVAQLQGTSSGVLYMNGTTDYVELYTYVVGTSPVADYQKQLTNLSGVLVRTA